LLYEDSQEMVGYLAQHLRQTSREATVLLYAPALDPHLQEMAELADRVFCIYNELLRCLTRFPGWLFPGYKKEHLSKPISGKNVEENSE
jgi:hypothetical protein